MSTVRLENITYRYSKYRDALVNATASIEPGIHLLLGENGSGKTTLLHVMAGLRLPQEGICLIDGEDVSMREPSVLSRVFFLPDDGMLPCKTINEFSRMHAGFYPNFSAEDLALNLADFGLSGDEPLKALSLGMRKKAAIAYVLALHCAVTLLDEPTNGLDINAKKQLRHLMMRNMRDDAVVIVSTHTVWDLEQLFDGVMMLRSGHIMMSRTVDEITSRLAFVTSPASIDGALYQEFSMTGYRGIVESSDDVETQIDYNLLYSALMSPSAESVLGVINNKG
ncbi:MAG: ABC transporter ATP-binding protein [Muribaculaceae bacterium]|nr:ABC transporter ATP-binding protein [Muribaculaceae bacterium]